MKFTSCQTIVESDFLRSFSLISIFPILSTCDSYLSFRAIKDREHPPPPNSPRGMERAEGAADRDTAMPVAPATLGFLLEFSQLIKHHSSLNEGLVPGGPHS